MSEEAGSEPLTEAQPFSSSGEDAITKTVTVTPDSSPDPRTHLGEFLDYYEIENTARQLTESNYKSVSLLMLWYQNHAHGVDILTLLHLLWNLGHCSLMDFDIRLRCMLWARIFICGTHLAALFDWMQIALQFPDELLHDSVPVYQELRKRLGEDQKAYVLADTSYGR
jgi:hypothetical protein